MMIKGLGHVGIEAKNLEETLAFYRDILGFEQITDNAADLGPDANYFLRHGSVTVEILMIPDRDVRPWGVINHLSLLVDDVEAAWEELKSKGVEFETDHILFDPLLYDRGEKYIMFKGPNGERLQLEQIL